MKSFSWAALKHSFVVATASHAQTEVRLAVHKSFSLPKDALWRLKGESGKGVGN